MDVSATGFWAGSISRQSEKRFPETAKSKKNGGRRINAGLSRLIMKKLTDLEYLRLNTFQRLWYNIVLLAGLFGQSRLERDRRRFQGHPKRADGLRHHLYKGQLENEGILPCDGLRQYCPGSGAAGTAVPCL